MDINVAGPATEAPGLITSGRRPVHETAADTSLPAQRPAGLDHDGGVVAHPLLILPPDVQRPASLGQAALRHPGRSPYRCFLPDLTGFGVPCRAGPSHQHQTINAVSGGARPGGGIRSRCSGLRVQGTASTPSSTTIGKRIVGTGGCQWGKGSLDGGVEQALAPLWSPRCGGGTGATCCAPTASPVPTPVSRGEGVDSRLARE